MSSREGRRGNLAPDSIRMVDVGSKPVTRRLAIACGKVTMAASTARLLREQRLPKGDVLTTAKLAGILAAKRVDEWIPLCHTIPLDHIGITLEVGKAEVQVRARVECHGKTGVEMEALTAVAVACLTTYDMCKAVDQEMAIGPIYLQEKSGGRSGLYLRDGKPAKRETF